MSLNTAQLNALNSGNPAALAAGAGVGNLISELQTQVASGNLGIASDAWDVDSICEGGGHVAEDVDSHSGLTFGYFSGRILVPGTGVVAIAAGTIALSASSTNYVEASAAGVVSKNTVGFTEGSVPLFTVVTGSSSITTVTQSKALLWCRPSGGLPGSVLSTAAKTKGRQVVAGTLSATGEVVIQCPSHAATISRIAIAVTTTLAANDTDYWTFSAVNKGAAGTGTTALLAASDANTTKATGGSGLTNYVARALSLSGTPANLVTAANDILAFTATKAASAANLVGLIVYVEFTFTN